MERVSGIVVGSGAVTVNQLQAETEPSSRRSAVQLLQFETETLPVDPKEHLEHRFGVEINFKGLELDDVT
jgi:hypothetical protein